MTAFAASLTQRRGPTQISRKTQNLGTQSDLLILRGKKTMKWKRALEALSGAKMKESMKADETHRYPKRFMMKNDGNLS